MASVTKPATPEAVASAGALAVARTVAPGGGPTAEGGHLATDTTIADRYRVIRVLGEGGMGVVYAAEHVLMRKEVAVKVLHAEMCNMPEVVARFEREAIAAAHIDHPNVAAATDFGRLEDGSCYLVLELLRGGSLRDAIAKGPMPQERALRILRGITAGVAAAHAKGIIHRDLKPENVMLVERDGSFDFVKVLDFGIAKVDPHVTSGARVLTRIGAVFGTPEYMAPEQAVGDAVDARADLFSLGVILLEMLTGRCPYEGNAMSILRERILNPSPPDVSAIADPDVRALAGQLLAQQVADRMQTAAELLDALDRLLGGRTSSPSVRLTPDRPIAAGAASAPRATAAPEATPEPRRLLVPGLVALVALLLGAAAVVAWMRPSPPAPPPANANANAIQTPSAEPKPEEPEPATSAAPSAEPPPSASAASARAPRPKPRPRSPRKGSK